MVLPFCFMVLTVESTLKTTERRREKCHAAKDQRCVSVYVDTCAVILVISHGIYSVIDLWGQSESASPQSIETEPEPQLLRASGGIIHRVTRC